MSRRGLNEVLITGYIGNEPELRTSPTSGNGSVFLSIATTDSWKDRTSGEPKKKTDWHPVRFFGKKAEKVAEFFNKGSAITVKGSNRSTREVKDGKTEYGYYVEGHEFSFPITQKTTENNSGQSSIGSSSSGAGHVDGRDFADDDYDENHPF